VAGFGEYVEVLEPEDLRQEFGRIARNMASKYEKNLIVSLS
jgi:predicted DNA-binding transcriptional regulator YafY